MATEVCVICLETVTDGIKTPCGHYFHEPHILRYVCEGKDKCPVCRRNFPTEFIDGCIIISDVYSHYSLKEYLHENHHRMPEKLYDWIEQVSTLPYYLDIPKPDDEDMQIFGTLPLMKIIDNLWKFEPNTDIQTLLKLYIRENHVCTEMCEDEICVFEKYC